MQTTKGQTMEPSHPGSLICAFVIGYLESIVVDLAPCKISFFYLASVAEQCDLSSTNRASYKQKFSE